MDNKRRGCQLFMDRDPAGTRVHRNQECDEDDHIDHQFCFCLISCFGLNFSHFISLNFQDCSEQGEIIGDESANEM